MQRYLRHIQCSRQKLKRAIEKSPLKRSSVFTRGTILHETSIEAFIKSSRGKKAPMYRGNLETLAPEVASILLDATLRKSVSYSLEHLRNHLVERGHSKDGEIVKLLASNKEIGDSQLRIALLLIKDQTGQPNWLFESAHHIFQFGYVGNEVVSTFDDCNFPLHQFENQVKSGIPYLASVPLHRLVDMAKLAVSKDAVDETNRFMMRRLVFQMINHKDEFSTISHGEKYPEDWQSSFSCIEGFKRRKIGRMSKSVREEACHDYRFSIEVEMAMMDQMIQALQE
jgi:hypothetical protein